MSGEYYYREVISNNYQIAFPSISYRNPDLAQSK